MRRLDPGRARIAGARMGGILAAVMVAGCAANQNVGGQVEGPVGCYQFEWTESAKALGLPWGMELLSDPLEGPTRFESARRAVTRATATRTSDVPFNYWMITDSGDIRIGFDGRGAISLDLRPDGQALAGTGVSVGDAVGPDMEPDRTEYRVVAHRVVCPATP